MAGGTNTADPTGGSDSQGTGYIPPQTALTANAVSAGSGGGTLTLVFMTLALMQAEVVPQAGGYGVLRNFPLAAALLVSAISFGTLALAITALSGRRPPGYGVETPFGRLTAYVVLGLLSVVFYSLALDFLVRHLSEAAHLAAMVGTVLQILALAVGIYCRVPVAQSRTVSAQGRGERVSAANNG